MSLEAINQSSGSSFRDFFVKTTKESLQPFWNLSIAKGDSVLSHCPSPSLKFVNFVSFLCRQKNLYLERKEFTKLSPHPSPSPRRGCIRERISSRHYIRVISAVYSGYQKQKSFIPLFTLGRCLLIRRLGLSTISRLIGSGQPNHPSKRSPG